MALLSLCIFTKDHFDVTEDKGIKLGVFCTSPAIRNYRRNLVCEVLGTFVLVLVILFMSESGNTPEVGLGSIGANPGCISNRCLLVCHCGTTGYAINPARDPWPKNSAHAICPIKDKGSK